MLRLSSSHRSCLCSLMFLWTFYCSVWLRHPHSSFELVVFGMPTRPWLDQAIPLCKHGQLLCSMPRHSLIFAASWFWVYKELMVVSNANNPPPHRHPNSPTTSPQCATTSQFFSNVPHAIACSVVEGKRKNAKITSEHGIGRWRGCRSGERVAGNEPLQPRLSSVGAKRTGRRRGIR